MLNCCLSDGNLPTENDDNSTCVSSVCLICFKLFLAFLMPEKKVSKLRSFTFSVHGIGEFTLYKFLLAVLQSWHVVLKETLVFLYELFSVVQPFLAML